MELPQSLPRDARVVITEHPDGYRVLVHCRETIGPLHTAYVRQVGPPYRAFDDAEASAVVLGVLAAEAMIPLDLTEADAVRLARFATATED